MLVLSRRENEVIMIGDQIKLMVVDIRGDRVRLGIEAPHWVSIHRQEIYEIIQKERNLPCVANEVASEPPTGTTATKTTEQG